MSSSLQELTTLHLLEVAKKVTSEDIIWELGLCLGVDNFEIERNLNDSKTVTGAARSILLLWRKTVSTQTEAFKQLTKALLECRQRQILKDVFGVDSDTQLG